MPKKLAVSRAGRIPTSSLADHDAALLSVARAMFCEHGFARTTIAAIAREAHVSPKTIYARYGGKAGLFGASIDVRANDAVLPLRTALAKPEDLATALVDFAERLLVVTGAREAVLIQRLVIAESAGFPEIGERFLNAGPRHGARMLAAFFKRAEAAGYVKIAAPEITAEMFLGALLGIPGRLALIPQTAWYSEDERRVRAKLAVAMFLAAYGVPRNADRRSRRKLRVR